MAYKIPKMQRGWERCLPPPVLSPQLLFPEATAVVDSCAISTEELWLHKHMHDAWFWAHLPKMGIMVVLGLYWMPNEHMIHIIRRKHKIQEDTRPVLWAAWPNGLYSFYSEHHLFFNFILVVVCKTLWWYNWLNINLTTSDTFSRPQMIWGK